MRRERHTIFLCRVFHLLPHHHHHHHHVWHQAANYWSGLGEPRKSTIFSRGRNSTNCFFSNLSPRFRFVTSPKYPGLNSNLGFLFWHISEWHILSARAWTPALMLHLTNPCAKRKVLSLTKPKGKIYKTKSLGNYITAEVAVEKEAVRSLSTTVDQFTHLFIIISLQADQSLIQIPSFGPYSKL